MASIKTIWCKDVQNLEKYLFASRSEDDPASFYNCLEGSVADDFLYNQTFAKVKSDNEALHIIQSWSPSESKQHDPWEFNDLGKKMIQKTFPGHDYCIITHTDTDNFHNHIIVNPYNRDKDFRINNKKHHLYDLRAISDEFCLQKGLSIIEKQSKANWDRRPDEVKEILRRGGFSYAADLKEKAKLAMSLATSFDEYSGLLNHFGIEVKVTDKNISYRYPGRSRFKRANSQGLGLKYDKENLINHFKENDLRFIQSGIKTELSIQNKDYGKYFKFSVEPEKYYVPEWTYKNLVLPVDILKDLKDSNLKMLCDQAGIKYFLDSNNTLRLLGREHVRIEKTNWFNEDKKTFGGAWELLTYHSEKSWLEALKGVNSSDQVDLLVKTSENIKPNFQAFYIPKNILPNGKSLPSDFRNDGFNPRTLEHLFRQGQFKSISNERFKLYPEATRSVSLGFYKTGSSWTSRKSSGICYSLVKKQIKSKELVIFDSPLNFLKSKTSDRLLKSYRVNFLVPMQPLEIFLDKNETIFKEYSKIRIVLSEDRKKDIFQKLNEKTSNRQGVSIEGLSLSDFDNFITRELFRSERSL